MFKPLKYNRLKKVVDDKEERFVIEVDKYDPDTGEPRVEEHMIDPDQLDEREQVLQREIDKIGSLQDCINKKDFYKIEDKRTTGQSKPLKTDVKQ